MTDGGGTGATSDRPDAVVSDAEPIVVYCCDDPGSDVDRYVDAVEGGAAGDVSAVDFAGARYVVRTIDGEGTRMRRSTPPRRRPRTRRIRGRASVVRRAYVAGGRRTGRGVSSVKVE